MFLHLSLINLGTQRDFIRPCPGTISQQLHISANHEFKWHGSLLLRRTSTESGSIVDKIIRVSLTHERIPQRKEPSIPVEPNSVNKGWIFDPPSCCSGISFPHLFCSRFIRHERYIISNPIEIKLNLEIHLSTITICQGKFTLALEQSISKMYCKIKGSV